MATPNVNGYRFPTPDITCKKYSNSEGILNLPIGAQMIYENKIHTEIAQDTLILLYLTNPDIAVNAIKYVKYQCAVSTYDVPIKPFISAAFKRKSRTVVVLSGKFATEVIQKIKMIAGRYGT